MTSERTHSVAPPPPSVTTVGAWWGRRLVERWGEDNGSLIAAGVAFYCVLALVPAIGAFTGVYALVVGAPPETRPDDGLLDVVPEQVQSLLDAHFDAMRDASASAVTLGAVVAIVLALWSASAAVRHLLIALASTRTERSRPSYVHTRLLGFGLTAGLLGFLVVALAATAVLPRLLQRANLGESLESVLSLLQWPAVAFGMLAVAAVLYRVAGTEASAPRRRISVGAWIAASTWLVSSVGFASFFAAAPRIEASYGALAAAAVTLLWFWLFAGSLVLGAEIDRIALRPDRPRRGRLGSNAPTAEAAG